MEKKRPNKLSHDVEKKLVYTSRLGHSKAEQIRQMKQLQAWQACQDCSSQVLSEPCKEREVKVISEGEPEHDKDEKYSTKVSKPSLTI
jgi:hypothetical protein